MASEIIVQTIKGPTSGANANKIIIPSGQTLVPSAGQIVNHKQYIDTTLTIITSSTYSTVYTYPTYTPILTNSIIIHKFSVLVRTYRNGSSEGRGKLRFVVDGTTVIDDQEFGNYDYGGSGIWNRAVYSNGSIHTNTDGTPVSAYIQLGNRGTELEYNSDDGGSSTQSFYEIMEIAQ